MAPFLPARCFSSESIKPLPLCGSVSRPSHEAVHKGLVDAVLGSNIAQDKKVIERAVNATIGDKTHQMHLFSVITGIGKGLHDFGVGKYRLVGTSAVYLHEVLVYDTAGTDVEVTYLGVTPSGREADLHSHPKPATANADR